MVPAINCVVPVINYEVPVINYEVPVLTTRAKIFLLPILNIIL